MSLRHHCLATGLVVLLANPIQADPWVLLDLVDTPVEEGRLSRIYGSVGRGDQGVPVAGGVDVDGDGFRDLAVAYFKADPFGRTDAGEVNVIFGDGSLGDQLDTVRDDARILRFVGAQVRETAGNEVWVDDVTGDGIGDVLICRQNFTVAGGRIGAGALTIVPGGPHLRTQAESLARVDLDAPPDSFTMTTVMGAETLGRLGIWVRTGDVDGDGIADIVVGADQEGNDNRGAGYVILGGPHLASGDVVDLANFGATSFAGRLARIVPPPNSTQFHLGATCQIGDLDGNGRGEVFLAAALARAGAAIDADGALPGSAEANGGAPDGRLFVLWDDNFPAVPWPAGLTLDLGAPPSDLTILQGESANRVFGEEILAGLDYDGDQNADLFVGDLLSSDPDGLISVPGVGYVFYNAAQLRGETIDLDAPPAELPWTLVVGPGISALGADTAAHGDFDGDGLADLAFASPHASPEGRFHAGVVHVLFGQEGGWPARVDTAPDLLPDPEVVRISEIRGALGAGLTDLGDTLAYSATAADLDEDGRTDLILNEMAGNGLAPGTLDVGNLIAIGAPAFAPGVAPECSTGPTAPCVQQDRFRVEVTWTDFEGTRGDGTSIPATAQDSALFWFFFPDNWEFLVKVIDGCGLNGHFWVFAAATTNVQYTLKITDTVTSTTKTYENPLGMAAPAITDDRAFATCTPGLESSAVEVP